MDKKDVYLFVLDKFFDLDLFDLLLRVLLFEVDGEWMSGLMRFINYSCDLNMWIFVRVGDVVDKYVYDLVLFVIRDILVGEELMFDYVDGGLVEEDVGGLVLDDKKKDMMKCLCGMKKCRGFLW